MRICVNIEKDAEPRLIEEDIELALGKLPWMKRHAPTWELTEQGEGCFTADTEYAGFGDITGLGKALEREIEDETGAEVFVEIISGWPPK